MSNVKESRPKTIPLARIIQIYKVFVPFLKPYWRKVLVAYVAMALAVAMTALQPWPLKFIFDYILLGKAMPTDWQPVIAQFGGGPYPLLAILCAAIVVVVASLAAFEYVHKYFLSAVGQGMVADIRESVFAHLHGLSLAARSRHASGDLVVRLTSDINQFKDLIIKVAQKFAVMAFTAVTLFTVMAWMNWRLTLLVLIIVPGQYLLMRYFSRRIQLAVKEKRRKEGAVASIVSETLDSMTLVQAFAQERRQKQRFVKEARESLAAGLDKARLSGAFKRLLLVADAVGLAIVVGYGGFSVLEGQLTPGDLIVFMAYVRELYLHSEKFSEILPEFHDALVAAERILEVLEIGTDIADAPDAVKAPRFAGEVRFEHVTFGYRRDEPPVLRDLSFVVAPGQMAALVGSSGTGKSTVINLLLRFYDPWEGRILIDGVDIRRFTLKSLRRRMSTVLQQDILFRRTVRENIAFGKPKATLEEIVAAAKNAQAHDFIMKLPDGYDTIVDERGSNFSGGQRQRLALARAILRHTPILILDEPATGLDAVTETRLHETLEDLMRGTTTFIIAHKLSTVRRADLILVMEEGRVVEQGKHAELMAGSSLYRRFYRLQTSEPEALERGEPDAA